MLKDIDKNCVKSAYYFGMIDMFTLLNFSIHEHGMPIYTVPFKIIDNNYNVTTL